MVWACTTEKRRIICGQESGGDGGAEENKEASHKTHRPHKHVGKETVCFRCCFTEVAHTEM